MGVMRRRGVLVAATVAVLVATTSPAAGASTTGPTQAVAYQQDAGRTGAADDPWLKPPLVRRWAATHGRSMSSPLLAEGKVFTTAVAPGGTTIRAYERRDGKPAWTRPFGGTYDLVHLA